MRLGPLLALASMAGAAHAEPRREVVVTPLSLYAPQPVQLPPFLYLNRCVGNCTVQGGMGNNAAQMKSSIPSAGTYTVHEFANFMGSTGANGNCLGGGKQGNACLQDSECADTCNTTAMTCTSNNTVGCTKDADCAGTCETADKEWAALVQCMKEVYSPFGITLSDTIPQGTSYTEALIAGQPTDIGEAGDILGIAPLASDCSPQDNVISFSFANHHAGSGMQRVYAICWTAAQETAHAFGLDHEYQFVAGYPANGKSACMDPMTYRVDCGGEKFFRNEDAQCGEYSVRSCRCGGTQNSHQKILTVFGPGQSTIAPPTVSITNMPTIRQGQSFIVTAGAGSQRGVTDVELWLNGYPWDTQPAAAWGPNGQANPSGYELTAPASVPDGIIDIVVKAYDDVGGETDSATLTVIKGAPCASADNCATGQKCDSGKCFWDPPVGHLGDSCPYPQYCTSGFCSPTDSPICSQQCTVGTVNACPSGYDCVQISGSSGFCYPSSGGCCSVGEPRSMPWPHVAFGAVVLTIILRRRRTA